jgi:hypothetical protein
LFTAEEEKRELLFECMFEKGWQKTFVLGPPQAMRPTHPESMPAG